MHNQMTTAVSYVIRIAGFAAGQGKLICIDRGAKSPLNWTRRKLPLENDGACRHQLNTRPSSSLLDNSILSLRMDEFGRISN